MFPASFAFVQSEEEYLREMRRMKMREPVPWMKTEHSHATLHWIEADDGLKLMLCLGITKGRTKPQVAGLIAHEAAHVAQRVAEYIGEEKWGAETEAYIVQWVTQYCLHRLWSKP
jgi:hypothetical protein